MGQLYALITNRILISCALAFTSAEILKFFLNKKPKNFIAGGGMPSAHTAMVIALAAAIYLDQGPTPMFVFAVIFAAVVIYNALGTRWMVGEEARTINEIIKALRKNKKLKAKYLDILRGHKPSEVIAGGFIGFAIALIVYII